MTKTEDYKNLTDNELIDLHIQGDKGACEFLLKKYKYLVRSVTAPFFLAGADRADLIQEGMIGLFDAITCFKKDKGIEFKQFAGYCIKRHTITAVRAANRQKHSPLNSYISIWDDEGDEAETILPSMPNPESMIIESESVRLLGDKLKNCLSKMEYKVLLMFLEGKSYAEIAEEMNKNIKSIDNALQRIRTKIKRAGIHG